jgi:cell wall-associated NlpC family hydrolase
MRFTALFLLLLTAVPSAVAQSQVVYGVQVGAFKEFERAEQVQEALEDAGYSSYFSEAGGYKRVRIGPYRSREKAEREARSLWPFLVARFGPLEFQRSWVVVEDREIENAPILSPEAPAPVFPDRRVVARGDARLVLEDAMSHLGTPYRWGGTQPGGFDCSGFVQFIMGGRGFVVPRQAKNQFKVGDDVVADALEPGDLVFFSTYTRGASHVGIYIGEGEFIHSSSGEGVVTITPLAKRYYANRYLGARRVLETDQETLREMTRLVNR